MDMALHLQYFVSISLCTFIWIIQVLHYPFFQYIDLKQFSQSMVFHQRAISYLVIPLMLLELIVTIYIANYYVLTVVLGIWLSTFLIQVPLHKKLLQKKDLLIIAKLTKSNWIRTILWTLKLVIVSFGL